MGAREPGGSAVEGTSEDPSYLFYLPCSTNCYTAVRYGGGRETEAQDKEAHLKHRWRTVTQFQSETEAQNIILFSLYDIKMTVKTLQIFASKCF